MTEPIAYIETVQTPGGKRRGRCSRCSELLLRKVKNYCPACGAKLIGSLDQWYIASVSWGKDSLAMLHRLIHDGWPINEVVFFDTGMEFEAVYAERDRMLPELERLGITYIELKPKEPFLFKMFIHPVKKRGTKTVHKYGYGWCGGPCRWGTTEKTAALDRYAESKDAIVYVGLAADETARLSKPHKPYKVFPLAEAGMRERDCLEYCYAFGAQWKQGDVWLYEILDRVSCWCCRNKNFKELCAIHDYLPDYWEQLKALESRLGQMKSKPLDVIAANAQSFADQPTLQSEKSLCQKCVKNEERNNPVLAPENQTAPAQTSPFALGA